MYREIKAYTVKKFVEEKRLKFEDKRCNEIILHDIYKGGKWLIQDKYHKIIRQM